MAEQHFKSSNKIALKQNRVAAALFGIFVFCAGLILYLTREETSTEIAVQKATFDVVSKEVNPNDVRFSSLEHLSDVLGDRMQSLEKSILNLTEEKSLIEREKRQFQEKSEELISKVRTLEAELAQPTVNPALHHDLEQIEADYTEESYLKVWESDEKVEEKNVMHEIPAGTVLKAVLVSGADCSVAVQKPTGPGMILLRPIDNGKLPRNIKVPLKGSVIIGNVIGDLSEERVYIRAERMTIVERDGSFVETEVTAFITGEDGCEGMRGVVVDRSGQILTRAAFAAFLQGMGQGLQASLNNQTIQKMSQIGENRTLLDADLFRNSAAQGGSTALDRLSEYYIKRAEQLQPSIHIAPGRIVNIIFSKTTKFGENSLRKKIEKERELKHMDFSNG
jgi:conjugal transfer pilus assembly protein TraB